MIYLQNLEKNKAFRLYFSFDGDTNYYYEDRAATAYISKDGNTPTETINSVVGFGLKPNTNCDMYYLDLTADEMDANIIMLNINSSISNYLTFSVCLYTGSISAKVKKSLLKF